MQWTRTASLCSPLTPTVRPSPVSVPSPASVLRSTARTSVTRNGRPQLPRAVRTCPRSRPPGPPPASRSRALIRSCAVLGTASPFPGSSLAMHCFPSLQSHTRHAQAMLPGLPHLVPVRPHSSLGRHGGRSAPPASPPRDTRPLRFPSRPRPLLRRGLTPACSGLATLATDA